MGKNNINRTGKSHWQFSAGEKRGIIALLICFMIFFVSRQIHYNISLRYATTNIDTSAFEQLFAPDIILDSNNTDMKKELTAVKFMDYTAIQKLNIDSCTANDLIRIGFRPKIAQTLINFRTSIGGHFTNRAQLLKIYGINESEKNLLQQVELKKRQKTVSTSIELPNKTLDTLRMAENKLSIKPTKRIDINRAQQADWESLHGIGPYYAKRIVAFRTALGGFYDIDQIKDTYHLPDSIFQTIKPMLMNNESVFRKISLNNCSYEELERHPYLDRRQAQTIYRFIAERRPIDNTAILYETVVLDSQIVARLLPYIKL